MASGTIAISRLDAVALSCALDPAQCTGLLQATVISDHSADRNRATAAGRQQTGGDGSGSHLAVIPCL
jgi:hypothetical protein